MKNLINKNIAISTLSAVAGAAVVVAAFRFSPSLRSKFETASTKPNNSQKQVIDEIISEQKDIQSQMNNLLSQDFFSKDDPFAEMKQLRDQFQSRIDLSSDKNKQSKNPFDSWFSEKFGGGSINDISQREDDHYIYYDINIGDVKSTSVKTKIQNGFLTVSGVQEKKNNLDDKGNQVESYFKTEFSRTIPLPKNLDYKKMEMTSEKNMIELKFPKKIT